VLPDAADPARTRPKILIPAQRQRRSQHSVNGGLNVSEKIGGENLISRSDVQRTSTPSYGRVPDAIFFQCNSLDDLFAAQMRLSPLPHAGRTTRGLGHPRPGHLFPDAGQSSSARFRRSFLFTHDPWWHRYARYTVQFGTEIEGSFTSLFRCLTTGPSRLARAACHGDFT
jgi:hypothetical protein